MADDRQTDVAGRRVVTVSLAVEVELLVDDTAVSDWKGYTIQGAFADAERWVPDINENDKWLTLAEEVGISRRSVSLIDGWADFPAGSVQQHSWPHVAVEHVHVEDYSPGSSPTEVQP